MVFGFLGKEKVMRRPCTASYDGLLVGKYCCSYLIVNA